VHPLENCVAAAVVPDWTRRQAGEISKTMPSGSTNHVARRGSAISIPSGYWHATCAESPSLSVTFGIAPPMWLDIVRDALVKRLLDDPAWRQRAWGVHGGPDERAQAFHRFRTLLAELPSHLDTLSRG
jgi:hypothetical protein